jgi:predicted site-specific integrase-resolvase
VLDIMPIGACARHVGVSAPWVKRLVERGEVRVVADRVGRLYVPMREVERLAARYAHRRVTATGGSTGQRS